MKTLVIAASALAFVSPALGQTMAHGSAPAAAAQTAPVQAPDAQVPPSSAPSSDAAPAPAQNAASVIAAEFPTYNKSGSGKLSRAEFDTWMTALKDKSGGSPMKPAEMKRWLGESFAKADTDKDKAISQSELTAYLSAGG